MKLMIFVLTIFSSIFYALSGQAQTQLVSKSSHVDAVKQIKINKVLLVVAMEEEALPIIQALNLKKVPHLFSGLPMRGYAGKYAKKDIFLILNGKDPKYKVDCVATQPAALAAYLGIDYFHPDLVISIGTAGGIEEYGAKPNDVYMSQKIYFYDRRIPKPFTQYGLLGYVSPRFDHVTQNMSIKKGIICTGNSFDLSFIDKKIILQHKCVADDMEAASVAWVSMLKKIPMIAIKGISNVVGSKNSYQEYVNNGITITKKLADILKEFLKNLQDEKNIKLR